MSGQNADVFVPGNPLFTRPSLVRLFCAVDAIESDGEGRATKADVLYLDRIEGRAQLLPWDIGHVLHFHPFKLRLCSTPRAGLHVTSEWRAPSGEMRYGSNFMLRKEGVFVLNPSLVVNAGECLDDALGHFDERRLVEQVLKEIFGLIGGASALKGLMATRGPAPREDPSIYFRTC